MTIEKRAMIRGVAFVGCLVALVGQVNAEEPLVTDRPDFTESGLVVGRTVLQLEAGGTYVEADDEKATSLGELLVRYGITKGIELRLVTLTYLWLDPPGESSSGFVDSSIGAKIQLTRAERRGFLGRTDAALVVSTSFPSGNSEFRSDSWEPSAVLAFGWDLSGRVSAGVNLGYARPSGLDRFDSFWGSGVIGVGLTENTSAFFELFGFNREVEDGPSTLNFQTGVTHLLSPDLQLDARVARRVIDDGVDFLFGVGVSWRP
jgi:hypothetical protein